MNVLNETNSTYLFLDTKEAQLSNSYRADYLFHFQTPLDLEPSPNFHYEVALTGFDCWMGLLSNCQQTYHRKYSFKVRKGQTVLTIPFHPEQFKFPARFTFRDWIDWFNGEMRTNRHVLGTYFIKLRGHENNRFSDLLGRAVVPYVQMDFDDTRKRIQMNFMEAYDHLTGQAPVRIRFSTALAGQLGMVPYSYNQADQQVYYASKLPDMYYTFHKLTIEAPELVVPSIVSPNRSKDLLTIVSPREPTEWLRGDVDQPILQKIEFRNPIYLRLRSSTRLNYIRLRILDEDSVPLTFRLPNINFSQTFVLNLKKVFTNLVV